MDDKKTLLLAILGGGVLSFTALGLFTFVVGLIVVPTMALQLLATVCLPWLMMSFPFYFHLKTMRQLDQNDEIIKELVDRSENQNKE